MKIMARWGTILRHFYAVSTILIPNPDTCNLVYKYR